LIFWIGYTKIAAITILGISSSSRRYGRQSPGYSGKNHDVLYVSITITAVFLIAMSVSILSESTLHHHTTIAEAYAQPYVETVKHRNLTIDLGNGLKTNAQLTFPAIGRGPFPGVIIFPGSGAGTVLPPTSAYSHMAKYLSDRGFAVLRYDKRGVGPNFTISDSMHGAILHLTI